MAAMPIDGHFLNMPFPNPCCSRYVLVKDYGFKALSDIENGMYPVTRESTFEAMDQSGTGRVLFSEWCKYLKEVEVHHQTAFGQLLTVDERQDAGPGKQARSTKGLQRNNDRIEGRISDHVSNCSGRSLVCDTCCRESFVEDATVQQQGVILTCAM